MHPLPRTLATLALGVGLLGLTPSAQAMRADLPASTSSTASRQAPQCPGQVVGIDPERRLTAVVVDNGVATSTHRSAPLAFDPSHLGYVSSKYTERSEIQNITAVSDRGRPRLLTTKRRATSNRITVSDRRIDSPRFQPRLFADTYTYRVYAMEKGVLSQWHLTRDRDGRLHFTHQRRVGRGFADLQSLQNQTTVKLRRQETDVLYYTTTSGALGRLLIPAEHPKRSTHRIVATTGYEDVTELSTAFCNRDVGHHLVMGIDPENGVATWTTITDPFTRSPDVVQRGEMTGADWHLHAAY